MTLCIWPVAPDPNGDGASQRAWYMLNALSKIEPVDLVVLQQADRPELAKTSLGPARDIARSVRFVRIPEWCTSSVLAPRIPTSLGRILDQPRIRSVETPRLSASALARIAGQMPCHARTVFVGRLSTACIVDDLCRAGLLQTERRFVDFDDIMSSFRRVQIARQADTTSLPNRWWQTFISRQMEQAEARIARTWDGCAVASSEDCDVLASTYPDARILHLPNVVERAAVPCAAEGPLNLLFVGNLAYPPNVDGIHFLLDSVWPSLRRSRPDISITVVGRAPGAALAAKIRDAGVDLHTDVADVTPFYANAHAVVAPIFFGGGTRIKIVEAMAFGKPIVATAFCVEGLRIRNGVHALLHDKAEDMVEAIVALADDPALRNRLGQQARALQQQCYGSGALDAAVCDAIKALPVRAFPPLDAAEPAAGHAAFGWSLQINGDQPAWA